MEKDTKAKKFFEHAGNILIRLHSWLQARWFIVSFVLWCSGLWFSLILTFFGEDLHFIAYNDKGKRILTPLGLTLTILVIAWTFLITIAQRYAEHSQRKNADAKIKNELTICVNRSVGNICNNKYNTLISLIDDIEFGRARPKPIISRPCDQLKSITREIADAIISILSVNNKSSIDYNDLYVSILYKFKGEKWKQTYSHMPERGLSLSEVTTKNGTTFHQAFDANNKNEENGYSFWVSKQEAKEKNVISRIIMIDMTRKTS